MPFRSISCNSNSDCHNPFQFCDPDTSKCVACSRICLRKNDKHVCAEKCPLFPVPTAQPHSQADLSQSTHLQTTLTPTTAMQPTLPPTMTFQPQTVSSTSDATPYDLTQLVVVGLLSASAVIIIVLIVALGYICNKSRKTRTRDPENPQDPAAIPAPPQNTSVAFHADPDNPGVSIPFLTNGHDAENNAQGHRRGQIPPPPPQGVRATAPTESDDDENQYEPISDGADKKHDPRTYDEMSFTLEVRGPPDCVAQNPGLQAIPFEPSRYNAALAMHVYNQRSDAIQQDIIERGQRGRVSGNNVASTRSAATSTMPGISLYS